MNKYFTVGLLLLSIAVKTEAQQWPIANTGPANLSSTFGPRLGRSFHGGIDIPAVNGTEVVATRSGIVTAVGFSGSLGNYVVISNRDVYGHLSTQEFDYLDVRDQTPVDQGDPIGASGNSGPVNTSYHLHMQDGGTIVDSISVHPLRYLPYTPTLPTIRSFGIEKSVIRNVTFITSGTVRLNAFTSAITRDLDLVIFDVFPTLQGFPMRFDYASSVMHDTVESPGDPLRVIGGDWFAQTQNPGQPTLVDFYYTYDTRRAINDLYPLRVCLTNTRGTESCSNYNWLIDNKSPILSVTDNSGDEILPGGICNLQKISILVNDGSGNVSQPGKLEIYNGDPENSGILLASNDEDFDDEHSYTADDTGLSILDNMPEGLIFIRAHDQAGNFASVNFTINRALPKITYLNTEDETHFVCEGSDNCGSPETPKNILWIPSKFKFEDTAGLKETKIYKGNFGELYQTRTFTDIETAIETFTFDDGLKYTMIATDTLGQSTTMYFQADALRPFLKTAIIENSENEEEYHKQWIFDGTNLTCPGPVVEEILGKDNYTVKLEFSEPVVISTISINTFDDLTLSSDDPVGNQKKFRTTLIINNNSPIKDGEYTMTVKAVDLTGNALLALNLSQTIINLFTQLTRDAGGIMQGTGGSDTTVKFIIEREPPKIIHLNTEEKEIFVYREWDCDDFEYPKTVYWSPAIFAFEDKSDLEEVRIYEDNFGALYQVKNFAGVKSATETFTLEEGQTYTMVAKDKRAGWTFVT